MSRSKKSRKENIKTNRRKPEIYDEENEIEENYNSKIKEKKQKRKTKKEKHKKGIIATLIGKIIWLCFIILLIAIIIFCIKTMQNGGGLKGAAITLVGTSKEEVENLEPINILLLGISEDLNNKLTDTIILCTYNPQNQKASMISIPRDTYIGENLEEAKSNDKINTMYKKSKDKLLKKVSEITGKKVENYAVVNTEALIKIVDIIGGVKYDVPIDMNYDDPTQDLHIHLEKGTQKIDGEKAEQLLRFRHNNDGTSYPASYGDNDFGRMRTQRTFMEQTIKQTINVKNIFKIKSIYTTILENIETNIDIEELFKYIPSAIDFNINSIENKQLPGKAEKHNEIWFFIHNENETKKIMKEIDI